MPEVMDLATKIWYAITVCGYCHAYLFTWTKCLRLVVNMLFKLGFRQFTDRQFAVVGKEGKVYGYATSTWALINLDSRGAVDLSGMKDSALFSFVIDEVAPIPSPARVRITSDVPLFTHRAAYTDLDINGHVNSIRYIQMALDCLSEFIYKQNLRVQRVEVGYAAEGMCGDELQFFANELTANGGGIEVRNENGTTLAKINVVLSRDL